MRRIFRRRRAKSPAKEIPSGRASNDYNAVAESSTSVAHGTSSNAPAAIPSNVVNDDSTSSPSQTWTLAPDPAIAARPTPEHECTPTCRGLAMLPVHLHASTIAGLESELGRSLGPRDRIGFEVIGTGENRRIRGVLDVPEREDGWDIGNDHGVGTTPGDPSVHVCTPLCDGLAFLPEHLHAGVIAKLEQDMGRPLGPDDEIKLEGVTMKGPPRLLDVHSLPQDRERMFAEGDFGLGKMPLDLPTTFEYPVLPKGHARFLKPIGWGAHPLARLESHSLDAPPKYIAVSYCWDPTSPKRSLFLNEKSFSTTETVLEVLNQFASSKILEKENCFVWLDQICINQADHEEKMDQIYRMGEIYSKAEEVYIWLGPTTEDSRKALETMPTMLQTVSALVRAPSQRADITAEVATSVNENGGAQFGHLFLRPWFQRLWTVQEALLARSLVVMCGYRDVDFALLVKVAQGITAYGSTNVITPSAEYAAEIARIIKGTINLASLRAQLQSANKITDGLDATSFLELVREARFRQVTEPTDRVLALIGVAPEKVRDIMATYDYKLQTAQTTELWIGFTTALLQIDEHWRILSHAPSIQKPNQLPSWVPNFASRPPYASVLVSETSSFSAGISEVTANRVKRSFSPNELQINGFELDSVVLIVEQTAYTEENQNERDADVFWEPIQRWVDACLTAWRSFTGHASNHTPLNYWCMLAGQSCQEGESNARLRKGCELFRTVGQLVKSTISLRPEENPQLAAIFAMPDGLAKLARESVNIWRQSLADDDLDLLLDFMRKMKATCAGRSFFITRQGLLGLGCPGMKTGDSVCLFYGSMVPYVLRFRPKGDAELIGDAYVKDIMDGELLSLSQPQEIFLIR